MTAFLFSSFIMSSQDPILGIAWADPQGCFALVQVQLCLRRSIADGSMCGGEQTDRGPQPLSLLLGSSLYPYRPTTEEGNLGMITLPQLLFQAPLFRFISCIEALKYLSFRWQNI